MTPLAGFFLFSGEPAWRSPLEPLMAGGTRPGFQWFDAVLSGTHQSPIRIKAFR